MTSFASQSSTEDAVVRRWQFAKFLATGGLSFVVDVGVLILLREQLGLSVGWATTGAFGCAFVVNFGLNAGWVFGAYDRLGRRLIRYCTLVAANYVMTLGIVLGLTAAGLWYVAAKIVAVAICTLFNFWAYRHWVYA